MTGGVKLLDSEGTSNLKFVLVQLSFPALRFKAAKGNSAHRERYFQILSDELHTLFWSEEAMEEKNLPLLVRSRFLSLPAHRSSLKQS